MTRAFTSAATDFILEHGPLTLEQLHRLAVERQVTRTKNPSTLANSLTGDPYVRRPDGRYDTAARLLRGQVFTTRPRNDGLDDVLWTHRDLDPLLALPRLPRAEGGEIRLGHSAVQSWTGPPGWLPPAGAGRLLGFRWDGAALHVDVVDDAPLGDSDVVQDVREVLGRHARAQRRYGWSYEPRPSLTTTVISALVEDPTLFARPLPPLRELLPLPEDLRPQDDGPRDSLRTAHIAEVPLPERVHDELCHRADLLGERLPEYLSLLLSAAADRVQLPPPRYDRYLPYAGETYPSEPDADSADVVRLDAWTR